MSNFWGGHVLMDPQDLEKFFSNQDSMNNLPSVWEEPDELTLADFERVKPYLNKIPPRESDFLDLYYFKKVRQTGIAELFNVSQPTVCYRLIRATARLRYLLSLPPHTYEEVRDTLRGVLSDEMDITIMLGMLETTCQSEVARSMGVSQGLVRHRFFRTLSALEQMRDLDKCVEIFKRVSDNFNILSDTCRFKWKEDVIYSIHWEQ